ncbi:hypothetical protein OMAG_002615 [Candidatus Omnitrophus magneticus]|uniref:Tetratricopeptide repeat protein n=1 Tax=Candidatus Omnitrophus magneticus TaxID=1609969 RepID=A0A0F0CJM5_9BACT|nr:hypothetical protein OMAG_002615 [Candidatus Omnitrophus magneticus]
MIKTFVGHSFDPEDESIIIAFKKAFDSFKKSMPFEWEDAEVTQIKPLSEKVRLKMKDKNLFIGIFTRKYIEVDPKKLIKPKFLNKDTYVSRRSDCAYGTSYWIYQESGYAIAREMKTLFLVENGVRELKGLHADTEYIYFERGRESECFAKLNEALGQFLNDKKCDADGKGSNVPPKQPSKSIDVEANDNITTQESVETQGSDGAKENKEEKNDPYYFRELYIALLEKDNAKFDRLKNEVLEKYKTDEVNMLEWQAKILSLESLLAQKDVLSDLKDLQKKKPDNSVVAYHLGQEYEKYKNYEKAVDEYLKSAKHESKVGVKLHRIHAAALAYVKNSQKGEAVDILLKAFSEGSPDDEKRLIYGYLADVAKAMEDNELFTALAEKALAMNPSNNSLRFSLSYKYSNMDKDGLALYHYNILAANSPDSSNCNNLGVAYASLGMHSKAVESYIRASELGATISRANLAQKLLNEGFVDLANEQLKEAMKSENYEKDNVGRALSRIDSIREEENKKEKEALESVVEERNFKQNYAEAYSIGFAVVDSLSGDWSSKHGQIEIRLKSGSILHGKKEETIEESNWFLGLTALSGGPLGKVPETRTVKYIRTFEGKIIKNRAIEYKLKIERQPAYNTLLTQDLTITEFSGRGYINKEMSLIKIVELDKDKKQSFSEMKKA